MLYILDTDHLSLLQRNNQIVLKNLTAVPVSQRATTVINLEEQTRGPLASIRKAQSEAEAARAFNRLRETFDFFNSIPVLTYEEDAVAEYQRLSTQKLRVGTQDLRIAAIALSHSATVVTRNIGDFGRVQGLLIADWSVISSDSNSTR